MQLALTKRSNLLSADPPNLSHYADDNQKKSRGGGGGKPRSVADLRAARESRANEALKMKDEQLRILTEQNNQLLGSLDQAEEEANAIQMEKLAVEEENRTLRDTNFEVQSKARAADAQLKKVQSEVSDKDKQLKIMTDQNRCVVTSPISR